MPGKPDNNSDMLAHADAVLGANAQMLGEIQDGLQAAIDAPIAAGNQSAKSIATGLRNISRKATNYNNGLVADIATGLQQAADFAIGAGTQTVDDIGRAAATRSLHLLPQPADIPGPFPVLPTAAGVQPSPLLIQPLPTGLPPTAPAPRNPAPTGAGQLPKLTIVPPTLAELWVDCQSGQFYLEIIYPAGQAPPGNGGPPPPPFEDTGISYPWINASSFSQWELFAARDTAAWLAAHCPGTLPSQPAPPSVAPPPPPAPAPAPAPSSAPPPPPCPPPTVIIQTTTIPPPPPPAIGDFPALACIAGKGGSLPTVGTEEWCACMDSIVEWLDQVGQVVGKAVAEATLPSEKNPVFTSLIKLANSIVPYAGIGDSIADLVEDDRDAFATAYTALATSLDSFAAATSAKLIGLTFCRTLLRLLKNFRVGWDIAAWLTIDIEVQLVPIEKLLDYAENYVFAYEIPGFGDAVECYLQHTAPEGLIFCWMKCHGHNPEVYMPVIDARREKLQTEELIQFARRQHYDEPNQAALLAKQGWIRPEEAAARVTLYNELPTITDHLHFLQRNAYDTQYVIDYNLLDGFASDSDISSLISAPYVSLPNAHARTNFWDAFGDDLYAQGMLPKYGALHYAAHWINPSMGQLAEMMQRLRPGRVDPSISFTADDFERLLVEQDVAPYFRKRIEAISFRTLPLRQLNAATQQGRFDRTELVERWRDIGYPPADAELMADTSLATANRQSQSSINGYTAHTVSELYAYNLLTDDQVAFYLQPQGYTPSQIGDLKSAGHARRLASERRHHDEAALNVYAQNAIKAYGEGVLDRATALGALDQSGYSVNAAGLALDNMDLQNKMNTRMVAVKSIHKAFIHGEVDIQGAIALLLAAEIQPDRANTYAQDWSLELTVPRVYASTGAIEKWARDGFLSIPNATARLLNLGWPQPDVMLKVAEIEAGIKKATQLAATRQAAQLVKAQAAAKKALAASQKQYCKYYGPARLVKLYAARIIDEGTFRDRCDKCGLSKQDTDEWFNQATIALEKADKKAQKSGATGTEYVGPGAVPGGPAA